MLPFQMLQPLGLLRTDQFRFRLFCQREEVVPMPFSDAFLLACGNQPLAGVFANRFQHRKARFAGGLGLLDQALASQRFDGLENVQF